MPCYHPQRVALDADGNLDWSVYNPVPDLHEIVLVPCRHCVGCKSSESREWAIRCYHEALYHWQPWTNPETRVTTEVPLTSVVTLTYDEEHLPDGGLLQKRDLQLFLKRLRNRRSVGAVRFFAAGEYGGTPSAATPYGRPHYHVILFGEDFADRYQLVGTSDKVLYSSYELDEIWQQGRCTVDDVNFESIRYVCAYVAKKNNAQGNLTGPLSHEVDETTGELKVIALEPEFRVMSKKPGLGSQWIKENFERVYPVDNVVINGQEFPPPTFYDRWLKANHPGLYRKVQDKRLDERLEAQIEWTPERCSAAESIKLAGKMRKDSL